MPNFCLAIVTAVALAGCATAWPDHPCTDYFLSVRDLAEDERGRAEELSALISEWPPTDDQWEVRRYETAQALRAFAAAVDELVVTDETADVHVVMEEMRDVYLLYADILMALIVIGGRSDALADAYPGDDLQWPDIRQLDQDMWADTLDRLRLVGASAGQITAVSIERCKALR